MSYSRFDALLENEDATIRQAREDAEMVAGLLEREVARLVAEEDADRIDAVLKRIGSSVIARLQWSPELEPEVIDALWDIRTQARAGTAPREVARRVASQISEIPLSIARVWNERGVMVQDDSGQSMEAIQLDDRPDVEHVRVRFWDNPWPQAIAPGRVRPRAAAR